uniref:Small nuclear ribonucleoprotein Sm D3 n=2 Tax=Percomorphaceae TaxID=1489872 RepID=A0A8C9Y442_SANLU
MSIGVPIKVLHEAEGHIVTCETNTGEVYRGKLIEAEDNMNCQMSNITVTYRDGRVAQLEQVYIRGSKIRFLILPDMLKNAPMLKSMKNKNQGSGAGRGKAAILKAQGEWKVFGPPVSPRLSSAVYTSGHFICGEELKHLRREMLSTNAAESIELMHFNCRLCRMCFLKMYPIFCPVGNKSTKLDLSQHLTKHSFHEGSF